MVSEKDIWDLLIKKGFTQEATAGIMGNTHAESANKPNNLQNSGNRKLGLTDEQYTENVNNGTYKNFVNDSIGYGLCQWTISSRKSGLLSFAKSRGVSIDDADMQIEFLIKELKSYGLYNKIVHSKDIYYVTKTFLVEFERPASVINKTEAQINKVADVRNNYSEIIYNKYASTFEDDMEVLIKCNVIHSADYWRLHKDDLEYLQNLIHNSAEKLTELLQDESTQLDKDLKVLCMFGVISDTAYWKNNVDKITYLQVLIHNIADALTEYVNS